MNKVKTESIEDILLEYELQLTRFELKFADQFGYWPYAEDSNDFKNLHQEQQKLTKAFWENKEVSRVMGLIDLYYRVGDFTK